MDDAADIKTEMERCRSRQNEAFEALAKREEEIWQQYREAQGLPDLMTVRYGTAHWDYSQQLDKDPERRKLRRRFHEAQAEFDIAKRLLRANSG